MESGTTEGKEAQDVLLQEPPQTRLQVTTEIVEYAEVWGETVSMTTGSAKLYRQNGMAHSAAFVAPGVGSARMRLRIVRKGWNLVPREVRTLGE